MACMTTCVKRCSPRAALGPDAHPIHVARLQLLRSIVQWTIKCQPEHWQQALERGAKAVCQARSAISGYQTILALSASGVQRQAR
jgi:hypothetical protein